MPELPEVETIRRGLVPRVVGSEILSSRLTLPRLLVYPKSKDLLNLINKSQIKSIDRHGKYLLFNLSNAMDLMLHLGMTGRLYIRKPNNPVEPHTHFVLKLKKSKTITELRFIDPRTFGKIALLSHEDYSAVKGLAHIGMDPLKDDFTYARFKYIFQSNRQIKSVLMDQSHIAGLGNIYVDEILFKSGINPRKSTGKLKDFHHHLLYQSILAILQKALSYRGTTILTYADTDMRTGKYQAHLKVYGREDKPCVQCNTPIKRIILGSRSTYYCPKCQK